MNSLRVYFLLSALFVSTQAFGFRGFTFKGRNEPQVDRSRVDLAVEKWIEQPVDHFNARDNRTWQMRYFENHEFFNGSGPILIMLGGEWAISSSYVLTGTMFDVAEKNGAIMYYTEHRYYGQSHPVKDTSSENLQYLSVDQALADVAYFIETKKRENPGMVNSSVVVFGGSYAGNMAAWARIKYPHLIQGAVASSAPVRAKADFFEYYEVVTKSLATSSKQCIEDIDNAFDIVEELLYTTDGPALLKTFFKLCELPDNSSPSSIGYFMNTLAEVFAEPVQYNSINDDGSSSISDVCDTMTDKSLGPPIMRLVKLVDEDECLDIDYDNFVDTYKKTSWEAQKNTGFMRLWLYQTCTEYGYYQTTSSNSSVFGSLVPVEFFIKLCTDIYGEYYDSNLLDSKVRRTNIMYGSSTPDVKNVVFTNGNVDPWHALSVLEDLNEYSPAILINGSSHCEDLSSADSYEVPELEEARKRVHSLVSDWLTSA